MQVLALWMEETHGRGQLDAVTSGWIMDPMKSEVFANACVCKRSKTSNDFVTSLKKVYGSRKPQKKYFKKGIVKFDI